MLKKIILTAFLATLIPFLVFAEEEKRGTTAFPFLKIGVGARQMGMAGAFVGLADDVNAIYSNPAGLGSLSKVELSATHNNWFEDVSYNSLSYAHPGKDYTFGLSLNYLDLGEMKETTIASPKGTGRNFEGDSLLTILSFSEVGEEDTLFWGLNLKLIKERIDDEDAHGIVADIGLLNQSSPNFRFGLAIQNLGPKIEWGEEKFRLPLTYKLGFSYCINKTTFSLEGSLPNDDKPKILLGLETWVAKVLALRAGYKFDFAEPDNKLEKSGELPTCLTAGLGFDLGGLSIDYAYAPYGYLKDVHRLSLTIKFPTKRERPASPPPLEEGCTTLIIEEPEKTEETKTVMEETEVIIIEEAGIERQEEIKQPLRKEEKLKMKAQILPSEESGFVKVKVNIKNISQRPLLTNLNYFALITTDGKKQAYHSLKTHLQPGYFVSGYLKPGEEGEGVIVYKASSSPSALLYEDAYQNRLEVRF